MKLYYVFKNYNNSNIYPLVFLKKANHLEEDEVKNEILLFIYSWLIPLFSGNKC